MRYRFVDVDALSWSDRPTPRNPHQRRRCKTSADNHAGDLDGSKEIGRLSWGTEAPLDRLRSRGERERSHARTSGGTRRALHQRCRSYLVPLKLRICGRLPTRSIGLALARWRAVLRPLAPQHVARAGHQQGYGLDQLLQSRVLLAGLLPESVPLPVVHSPSRASLVRFFAARRQRLCVTRLSVRVRTKRTFAVKVPWTKKFIFPRRLPCQNPGGGRTSAEGLLGLRGTDTPTSGAPLFRAPQVEAPFFCSQFLDES